MEMPSRSASSGRHGSRDSRPSALKPYNVDNARLSTPPTTAASHTPASIARAASANTLALDEHAVDTVIAGPRRPSAVRTSSVTENMLCR
jgi:hypothetical protein